GKLRKEAGVVRQRLAQLAIEVDVAWCLSYRVATTQSRNQIPGPESPANKVFTSEMIQRLAQTGMQMLGLYGQLEFSTKWAPLKGKIERLCLSSVAATIAAGTSEIHRNVSAERGLGLARSARRQSMAPSLREEQQLLQDSARDFLRQECPTTHVRAMEEDLTGYSPELWQKITELGWAGLMLPEQYDGSGY